MELIGLDTEFTGLDYWSPDWRLRLVQFDDGIHDTFIFDMSDPLDEAAARACLEQGSFVSHNDADVISVWMHFGIDISDRNIDTLTLANLLWPRDGKEAKKDPFDLKSLATRFLGPELQQADDALHERFRELYAEAHPGRKGRPKAEDVESYGWQNISSDDPAYRHYAGLDAREVRRLAFILLDKLTPELERAWQDECKVRAIATRMRIRGMRTNPVTVNELHNEWSGRLNTALQAFLERYGCSARNTQKVSELLLIDGVALTERTKPSKTYPEGQWALGKKIVEDLLADNMENEKLQLLQTVADNSNVSSFLTTLLGYIDSEGLIHSSISTLGTVTGRWSVTQPAVQTVSSSNPCRSVFVPRPGNVLVSADLGQIEPRVAVGLAEERNLIPDLVSGIDVYSAATNAVFGPDYTPKQRKYMKRAILGTLYAAGITTLVRQARLLDGWLDANAKSVGEVRNQWKKTAPAIEAYSKYLQRLPIVRLGSGRYVPQDPERRYKAINSACQGTARDELMTRLIKISERYDEYLVMTFHDEILLDVPVDQVVEVCTFVRQVMEQGYAGVPTPCDTEIFPNAWSGKGISLEEYLNGQGQE